MKHEHIQEAARDAKQMEENSILSGDPLLETCTCTRWETNFNEMCDYCQKMSNEADCERIGDGHDSDCATHDAPAYPAGVCDCSASLVQRLRKMSAENKAPRDCIDEAADEIERLRKDSERLEWLMRNVSGEEFRRLGVTYGGNCGRDRIDAAMKVGAGGLSDLTDVLAGEPKQLNRCVVRLRTTMWADKSGLHTKKSLTFLRRKSEGFNVLEEDTSAVGAEGVLPRILNMDECPDGVYEVVTCNESRDYETGYIDDYDYRLVAANV